MSLMDSSRRIASIFTVLIMLTTPMAIVIPNALAGTTTSFSDGEESKVFDLSSGPDTASSIVVPGHATVLYASAKVSTVEGEAAGSPYVDLGDDGSIEWAFTGTGYGDLGHQTVFKDGSEAVGAPLPNGGTTPDLEVLLPKDAVIENANVDLKVHSRDTFVKWGFEGTGVNLDPDTFATPELGDLDNDGDPDMLVGSSTGLVYLYDNDGTATDANWTGGSAMQNQIGNDIDAGYNSVPALVDIDADNDLDLVIGAGDGTIIFYENTGNQTDPVWTNNNGLFGSADIGFYAAPTFADMDNDGDMDMYCGEYYGRVAYAENTGTAASASFDNDASNWVWETDDIGIIDVGFYSAPSLVDLDNDTDLDLIIGSSYGYFYLRINDGDMASSSFTSSWVLTAMSSPMVTESSSHPAIYDLDSDSDYDIIAGSGNGNIYLWNNTGTNASYNMTKVSIFGEIDPGTEATPTLGDMDNDGDLDILMGDANGDLHFIKNVGNSTDPSYMLDRTLPTVTQGWSAPQLLDYDGDKDLDVVLGNATGVITYLKNIGGPSNMVLQEDTSIFGVLDFGGFIRPSLADMDGDGDQDLTVADNWYGLSYYENKGSLQTPDWVYDGNMYNGINAGGYRASPSLYDFDGDGDFDLILGNTYGTMVYYENSGGKYDPKWSIAGSPFSKIDAFVRAAPALGDLNGDSMPDLVLGNSFGQLQFYQKQIYSNPYDVKVTLLGEAIPLWSQRRADPVLWETLNITDGLSSYLSSDSSNPDNFGTKISTIEFLISVALVGSDVNLEGLNITYSLSTETNDMSDSLNTYMKYHLSDVDAEGNLSVPMGIGSSTGGRVNISGLNIQYDGPPRLVEPIPDLEVPEESSNDSLLDLHAYFEDEETRDDMLDYSLEWTTFNQSIISVSIFTNRYLAVDSISSPESANWTGSGSVMVSAKDTLDNKVFSNEFTITITDVNDDPWFVSEPVLSVMADQVYSYDADAKDMDLADQLLYSLEIAPNDMNINPISGRITWMPTNAQVGVHPVRVAVSDGESSVLQTFSVTVNANPATNHAPVFTSFPVTVGFVGTTYIYDADAMDSDPGTTLRFELAKGPDKISLDEDTGELSWDDIIRPYVGMHDISLKVTDGIASDYQNFTLIISLSLKDNLPPRFKTTPRDYAYPDETYSYEMLVDDPNDMDRDNLEVWLESGPGGMEMDRPLTLTWTPTKDDIGDHTVIIGVKDLAGTETFQSFTLHVIQVAGQMAVLILSPDHEEKVFGNFKVVGTLNTSLMNAIQLVQVRVDGKDWKDATGTKTWSMPMDLTPGRHAIEARATDGKNNSAIEKITVFVKDEGVSGVGDSGSGGLILLLIILIGIMLVVGYIIGHRRGTSRSISEEQVAPQDPSSEALAVKEKEARFYDNVYAGKEMCPPTEKDDEAGFKSGSVPPEEPPADPEPIEEAADQGNGPVDDSSDRSKESGVGPEPEVGAEPEVLDEPITKTEAAPSATDKAPKAADADTDKAVLDDILSKLQD